MSKTPPKKARPALNPEPPEAMQPLPVPNEAMQYLYRLLDVQHADELSQLKHDLRAYLGRVQG